jgi:hypothetical protein
VDRKVGGGNWSYKFSNGLESRGLSFRCLPYSGHPCFRTGGQVLKW